MSENFGDGRVNGFAPGGEAAPLLSDQEAASLVNITRNRQTGRALAAILLVGIALAAASATGLAYLHSSHQKEAHLAYGRLADSCLSGSRAEHGRRYAEFQDALRQLDADDPLSGELRARHINLILLGQCR